MHKRIFNLLVVLATLVVTFVPTAAFAAPPAQEPTCEQLVTVQANDWLSKLADKYYGNVMAYPVIVEATNKKNASDSSFAKIDNPNLIEPGWKLCIVSAADAKAMLAKAGAAPAAPSVSGEKVTLRLWSHSDVAFQKANEELVARFIKQNPNVEIKYATFDYDTYIQNLQTSMAAGTEADVIVMFGSWVCSYARGGRLMEVPAEVMTYEKAKEIYFPSTLGGYYCDGKFYGLPNESNLECGGALVNPALFEKHGVPYPPKWEKFSDLIADAAKMTEFEGGTMTRAGFHFVTADGLSSTFLAGILEQGGSYFAPDGKHFTFDTPEARKIIQLMVDLAQKYKVVDPVVFNNDNNRDVTSTFFPGEVAIGYVGSWGGGEGRVNYPDMKFDYVAIPTYFGGERRFAADAGWGEVVSVNTKHPAEAWKLAKFMAADQENALFWNSTTGTIPAMKAIAANPGKLLETAPWVKPTFDLLPHGQYIGDLTDHDQLLYEIIYPHILEAMQGLASVEDTAKIIDTEANAMVDAKK